jgi:glycosyl transferase, family 25
MIDAFVINLDRDTERLAHMNEQETRAGLRFERVPGVLGADVPAHMRPKFLRTDGSIASDLTPGEVGCYASHLRVYEIILARGIPFALVLEDDVVLGGDTIDTVMAAMSGLPRGWDLVKLCNEPKKAVYSVTRLGGSRHVVRFVRQPLLAGAYLISANGARKMLMAGLRFQPIDVDLASPWVFGMDVYGVCPPPIPQLQTLASSIKSLGGHSTHRRKRRVMRFYTERLLYRLRTIGLGGLIACYAADVKQSIDARLARGWRGKPTGWNRPPAPIIG